MENRLKQFYRTMLLIRRFEEQAIELYKEGLVGGSYHPYIGQEAIAVGVCSALRQDDYLTNTYRGRGQHIAKGSDPSCSWPKYLEEQRDIAKERAVRCTLPMCRTVSWAPTVLLEAVPLLVSEPH